MIETTEQFFTIASDQIDAWDKYILGICSHSDRAMFLHRGGVQSDVLHRYDAVAGIGALMSYSCVTAGPDTKPFSQLRVLRSMSPHGWVFCQLGYDLKNATEDLISRNQQLIPFPDGCFYVPELVYTRTGRDVTLFGNKKHINTVFHDFTAAVEFDGAMDHSVMLAAPDRSEYIDHIQAIKEMIDDGRIYEVNYCVPFTSHASINNIESLFWNIQGKVSTPFSAYYKNEHRYVLSLSPERYMHKASDIVRSQPIKGTAARIHDTNQEREDLYNSLKDKAEHVMIVDLVRNDLKRNCKTGSIVVEELYGIYGFKHLYHMISTIKGEIKDESDFYNVLRDSFPMGSMTGAPKIEAMKVIEEREVFKRGVYSGSLGYINDQEDADFNVVIRSIVYDKIREEIVCPVGGAIVADSEPEKEWEECLLKLKGIQHILNK